MIVKFRPSSQRRNAKLPPSKVGVIARCDAVLVLLSESQVMGEIGGGVYVLMSGLDIERAILAAGPLG